MFNERIYEDFLPINLTYSVYGKTENKNNNVEYF